MRVPWMSWIFIFRMCIMVNEGKIQKGNPENPKFVWAGNIGNENETKSSNKQISIYYDKKKVLISKLYRIIY